MKNKLFIAVVLWVALIAALVVVLFDTTSEQSFFISFFATLSGIVIGIPIALGINEHQSKVQDDKDEHARQTQKKEMLEKVLSVVGLELFINQKTLSSQVQAQEHSPQAASFLGMKNDAWKAISDSGDLKWIDDPQLIGTISFAHFFIRRIMFFEDKFFDPHFNTGVVTLGETPKQMIAGQRALDGALAIREKALGVIERAIGEIEDVLGKTFKIEGDPS